MAYLVLARKSRPQTFDQVVGQTPVVKTLRNSIVRKRVAHAILFSGVRGVGKTTLARIMAKAINCTAEPAMRPCDSCSSCQEIAKGASLDLYEIDGASNRGIQEIRELKEKIRFLPTSSQYKVIIIDEVHMLTTEAFNALLKTLEEPPAHVYFMFATTEIHKIPVTILSRCQQYELKRIEADALYAHFLQLTEKEGFEIELSALSLIVREAGGSVRDGLSLLDQMFSFGETKISVADVVEVLGLVNRDILLNISKGLLDGSKAELLQALNEVFHFGIDLKRFLEDLMATLRGLLLSKIDGCADLIDLPSEELQQLQQLSAEHSVETIHMKLVLLMEVAEKLKFSAQPRLTLETSFLKIIESGNVAPISNLLGHFDELLSALPAQPLNPDNIIQVSGQKTDPQIKKNSNKPQATKPQPQIATNQSPPSPADQPPADRRTAPPQDMPVPPPPGNAVPRSSVEQTPERKPQTANKIQAHEKDVRGTLPEFIAYVKDRSEWMAQDLRRADTIKQHGEGELHLTYNDAANCSLLRHKDNAQLLTEFVLDFFQKPLTLRFIVPENDDSVDENGDDSPQKKRQLLANDPLTTMATEIFNGQIGDIRIGPRSR